MVGCSDLAERSHRPIIRIHEDVEARAPSPPGPDHLERGIHPSPMLLSYVGCGGSLSLVVAPAASVHVGVFEMYYGS